MMKIEIESEKEGKKEYDEWELKDACATLKRAEEIKSDSKLMAALKPYLEKDLKAIKSLLDLKNRAKALREEAKENSEYNYTENMDPYAEDRLEVMKKHS